MKKTQDSFEKPYTSASESLKISSSSDPTRRVFFFFVFSVDMLLPAFLLPFKNMISD